MLEGLRQRLEPVGINLIGVASVREYDEQVSAPLRLGPRWPAARSAIVLGSGGSAYWDATSPSSAGKAGDHRLDRFAEECVGPLAAEMLLGLDPVLLYPHRFDMAPVSFMALAACAGLGAPSRLGILIRPEYGTWFALRAAVLIDAVCAVSPRLAFDPCPACDKPCVGACPGGAVDADHGWNIPACASYRLASGDCGDGCHSRLACPHGAEHRYPPDEQRHHQAFALAAMRAHADRLAAADEMG